MDNILISIIIPTFNGQKMLGELLPTLLAQSFDRELYEIIISDDASTDDTAGYIQNLILNNPDYRIKYWKNSSNLSYGTTVNNGAKLSDAKYLVILNNDLICEPDLIKNLYDEITSDISLGAVNAFVLDYYNRDKIDSLGIAFDKNYNTFPVAYKQSIDCEFQSFKIPLISGCAFIINRMLFENIGGFSEIYYLYAEDTDLALKIVMQKYQFTFTKKAVCYHKHSATVSSLKIDKQFYLYRNHYYILALFFPLKIFWTKILQQLLKDIARKLKNKPRKYSFRVYLSIAKNILKLFRLRKKYSKQSQVSRNDLIKIIIG